MIKWQRITGEDLHNNDTIILRHYNILSKLGARLHDIPEIAAQEYRLAFYGVAFHCGHPHISAKGIKIPIPWMKNDHGIMLRVW